MFSTNQSLVFEFDSYNRVPVGLVAYGLIVTNKLLSVGGGEHKYFDLI